MYPRFPGDDIPSNHFLSIYRSLYKILIYISDDRYDSFLSFSHAKYPRPHCISPRNIYNKKRPEMCCEYFKKE